VHPSELEGQAHYRISIERFRQSRLRENLVSALQDSAIRKVNDDSDVRWGCIFYNGKHRVLTMHFDRFGKGYIGATRVATNGRIVDFLRRQFSCVWKGDYPA
jgi:hypothetical protein